MFDLRKAKRFDDWPFFLNFFYMRKNLETARSPGRTDTSLRTSDFESDASASSAIRASDSLALMIQSSFAKLKIQFPEEPEQVEGISPQACRAPEFPAG